MTHVDGNEYSFRSDGHAFPIVFLLMKRTSIVMRIIRQPDLL
jgi:hypothetical protein